MLLRAPSAWPPFAVAATAMVLLAVLDLGGAYAAKEAVARRSPAFGVLGVTLFVVLFWVYCSSLQYAELAPVTLGWIVVLQVGVVLLDRYLYGRPVPRGHWLAIVVVIAAQGYLVLAPTGTPPAAADGPAHRAAGRPAADAVPAPRDGRATDGGPAATGTAATGTAATGTTDVVVLARPRAVATTARPAARHRAG